MRLVALFAVLVSIWTGPAAAQEWNLYTPCSDIGLSAREVDYRERRGVCDPGELAAIHRAFGAPPLADVASPDGQAVRVTVRDGYGNLVVMAETARTAGVTEARVVVRGRGDPGRRPPELMQTVLEADTWDQIARRAPALEDTPALGDAEAPGDDDGDDAITLCIHPWSVVVETTGFGQARVLTGNACDDDEAFLFGWRLVSHAFEAFYDCGFLDPQYLRNHAARLQFCVGLSGEVSVAASAINAIQPFMDNALASVRLAYLLSDDFTLTLDGEPPTAGAAAAHARWRAFVAAGDYEMYFDIASGAEDDHWRQTAQITLLLIDDAWPDRTQARFAEIVQEWRREEELWLMQSMVVGAWQTIAINHDD